MGNSFKVFPIAVACVFIILTSAMPTYAATRTIQLKPSYNFIGLGASITQQQLQSAGCILGNWSKSNKLWQHYNMAENFFTVVQGTTELTRLTSTQTDPWLGYMIYEDSSDGCSLTINEQAETTLTLAPGYNLVSIPIALTQSQIEASGCQLATWARGTKRWDHFDSSEKLFTIVEGISYLTRITTTTMEPYKAYLIYNDGSTECTIDLLNLPTTTTTTKPSTTTTTTTKPSTTTTTKPTTTTTKPTTTTTIPSGITHTIYKIGSTYYLRNERTGSITNSVDFRQLFNGAIADNVALKLEPGTYYINTFTASYWQTDNMEKPDGSKYDGYAAGALLEISHWQFPRSNVHIYGDVGLDGKPNVIIKQAISKTYNDGNHGTLTLFADMAEFSSATNSGIYNIIFDQDYPNCGSEITYGVQWIIRMGGTDVTLDNCHLLNAGGCGIVGAQGAGVYIKNCIFNHINEHVIYVSGESASNYHTHITDCTFLNYGKKGRGYGPKLNNGDNIYIDNCYFNPNQDGSGYTEWNLPYYYINSDGTSDDKLYNYNTETGARGVIMGEVNGVFVTNSEWYSPQQTEYVYHPAQIPTGYDIHNIYFTNCKWTNYGPEVYYVWPHGASYNHNVAETHIDPSCTFN